VAIGGSLTGDGEMHFGPGAVEGGDSCSGTCTGLRLWKERPGFSPCCFGSCRLLLLPVRVGKTWTDNWNTGGRSGCVTPVMKCKIESRTDEVQTPAGTFGGCVRVRSEIRTTFGAGSAPVDPLWQKYHDGVRLDWYAPGVGLVKVDFQHAGGDRTVVELAEFKVVRGGESLFPNRVGNAWQYEWRNKAGALMLREFWRMAAKSGQAAHLGFSAVEFE